jgi:hypothetical protein
VGRRPFILDAFGIVALTAVANVVLGAIIEGPIGIALEIPMPPPDGPLEPLGPVPIALTTAIPLAIGAIVLAAARARSSRAIVIVAGLGIILGVASFVVPFSLPATVGPESRVGLASMHIVAIGGWLLMVLRARVT